MDESSKTAIGTTFIFVFVTEIVLALTGTSSIMTIPFQDGVNIQIGSMIGWIINILARWTILLILVLVFFSLIRNKIKWQDWAGDRTIRLTAGWLLLLAGIQVLVRYLYTEYLMILQFIQSNGKMQDALMYLPVAVYIVLVVCQLLFAVILIISSRVKKNDVTAVPDGYSTPGQVAAGIVMIVFLVSGIMAGLRLLAHYFLSKTASGWPPFAAMLPLYICTAIVIVSMIVAVRMNLSMRDAFDDRQIGRTSGVLLAAGGCISLISTLLEWTDLLVLATQYKYADIQPMNITMNYNRLAELAIYLLQGLLGIWLVMRSRRRPDLQESEQEG